MNEKTHVDFLTYLNVHVEKTEQEKLLLVRASGYSENEKLGVPLLIAKSEVKKQNYDGIMELDFIIKPAELLNRKRLEWDVDVVFDMNTFPAGTVGIKVKAAENADIVLLNTA